MSLTTAWIALVACSVLTGASLVGILVVRQSLELPVAVLGATSFGMTGFSLVTLTQLYGRVDAALYGVAFIFAGLGGGWALAVSLLDRSVPRNDALAAPAELAEPAPSPAFILFTSTEPPEYVLGLVMQKIQSLAEEELLDPTVGNLPFLCFAQKARYRAIGGSSPGRDELGLLAEQVNVALGGLNDRPIGWATCTGEQRLAVKVLEAATEGYRDIRVARVAVAESLRLAAAEREVDGLRLEQLGVTVTYTPLLTDSDSLASALARRVMTAVHTPDSTGVVIVGHGQPEDQARRDPTYDEQENAFMNRIRMMLFDQGLDENNVRIAWAEWTDPDVTSTVRHLAALGCQRILVLPAVEPHDTIGTILDLQLAIGQARLDDGVAVVLLPPWREDPQLVSELATRLKNAG